MCLKDNTHPSYSLFTAFHLRLWNSDFILTNCKEKKKKPFSDFSLFLFFIDCSCNCWIIPNTCIIFVNSFCPAGCCCFNTPDWSVSSCQAWQSPDPVTSSRCSGVLEQPHIPKRIDNFPCGCYNYMVGHIQIILQLTYWLRTGTF